MKSTWFVAASGIILAAVAFGWLIAADPPKAPTAPAAPKAPAAPTAAPAAPAPAAPVAAAASADETAIKEASQSFAKAFETGNDKIVAALFTEGAEYHDADGTTIHGRDELAKAYAGFFAKRKEIKVTSETDAIRFLGPDTAVEEGTFTVTPKDQPANSNRFSALYVRSGGKWQIALLKEWQDEATAAPKLEDLSWLIGTWVADGKEMSARTTYEWAPNKKFIKATYTITPKKEGEEASSGVQVIGVDPAVGQIRSWLFASDGGIGEANWLWEGDRWVIESTGTLADGTSTSCVNHLTKTGADTFTWRSVQRYTAGTAEADVPAVTVNRVKAAAAPAPAPGKSK